MGIKYTDERILEDLKFIFKTYGNLRNPSIIDSCKNYGTVPLGVLDRKYKTKDALYKLIGENNPRKTFYDWCIENNKQYFLDSWDYDLNECSPKDILYSAHKKFYFKCMECGNSQLYFINSFTNMNTELHCIYCNSFEKWCIDNNHQDYLDRWDYDKNKKLPSVIPKGSHTKIWLKCERGIHDSEQYLPHSIEQGLVQCNCAKCNSFAQWGIDIYGEKFLDTYWDYDLNTKSPFDIYKTSRKDKIWLKCQDTSYHGTYETTPVRATHDNFILCPFCANMKTHTMDSLGYTYPKSVELWSDKNKKTPFEYRSKSGKKAWFKCGCGKHDDTLRTISNAILNDFDCPQCVKERNESKIEETVRLYLTEELHYSTNHEFNCTIVPINPNTNHPLPFDNEIPELKLIIEVHGIQHYQMTDYFHSKDDKTSIKEAFEYQKWKDDFKKNYALEQGYNFLEIPYWKVKDGSYKKLINNKIKEILQEVA